jgi:hypothetical protein
MTVLHERAKHSFTADLGDFITIAPGTGLVTSIKWGDGTTSTGTLVSDGVVGLDELRFKLDGTHTYALPGRYDITATVTKPGPVPTTFIQVVATFSDHAIVSRGSTSLDGNITGTYSILPTPEPVVFDKGAEYQFTGKGTAGDLGTVSAVGDVTLPGNIIDGQAAGTLKLTTLTTAAADSGSVTLKLTGRRENDYGPFPKTLTYTILSGTGIFTGASGTGTIAVTLGGTSASDVFSFTLLSQLAAAPA